MLMIRACGCLKWASGRVHLTASVKVEVSVRLVRKFNSTSLRSASVDRLAYRNVSFWGHIDAGKTTLTERVLYLAKALSPQRGGAGHDTQLPGDVDSGSTVTDFLDAERQRGITIQSAAVGPFFWKPTETLTGVPQESKISLIDTPGHIDFTIEVERSLRVADGCVVLIDGVEGVESQTESVWRIAQRYNVRSHIVLVNKLDRMGASLSKSVRSILQSGLHPRPVILQLPIFSRGSSSSSREASLIGIIDLTTMPLQAQFYGGRAGEAVESVPLEDAVSRGRAAEYLIGEAQKARAALIESIGSLDEGLLEGILTVGEDQSPSQLIMQQDLRAAIRRQTIQGEVLPVLCGSAQKCIGIQSVLDAINWYLPAPEEAGDREANQRRMQLGGCVWGTVEEKERVGVSMEDKDLSLLAFKVVWDKQRGPMTFVRLYSGTLSRSTTLYNTTTQSKERLSKILFAYADRFIETESLQAGQIGVLLGLKDTRTGDTMVDGRNLAAKKKGKAGDGDWTSRGHSLRLRKVDVPEPVFSVSLEPMGKSDEDQVKQVLEMLIRTDPSLRIDYGDSTEGGVGLGAAGTGQMVLSGMGELHLEIAKDRLLNEFNARATMGSVRVSYRETLSGPGADSVRWLTEELDRDVMGKRLKAGCEIGIRALQDDEGGGKDGGNTIQIELGTEGQKDDFDTAQTRHALENGLTAALARGPLSWNAVTGLHIALRNITTHGPQLTTPKALTMLASQALHKALKSRDMAMMEPVMKVRILCDELYLGKVSSVLASEQGGIVERVDHEAQGLEATEAITAVDAEQMYLPPDEESVQCLGEEKRRSNVGCTIHATVPLVKLVNYSSKLRAITKGTGTFEMTLHGFTLAGAEREKEILTELGRI